VVKLELLKSCETQINMKAACKRIFQNCSKDPHQPWIIFQEQGKFVKCVLNYATDLTFLPEIVRKAIGAAADVHIQCEAVHLISDASKQALKTH
jgi:hypothetical protein